MKKKILLLSILVAPFSFGQTLLPTPVYQHSFTGTLSNANFVVSSAGNSLTSDRNNVPQRAAQLSADHGIVGVNINSHKPALLLEGTVTMYFKYAGTGTSAFGSDKPLFFLSNGNGSYSEGVVIALSETGVIKVTSYQNGSNGGSESSAVTSGSDGNWHHFAVSWKFGSGGFIKGYLDGSEVVSRNHSHSLSSALSNVYFTGFDASYPSSLFGSIDEICIFTTALSETQIAALDDPCSIDFLMIPNTNFKNALLNHNPTIDTNNDGAIQCSEAAAFTGTLNVASKNISDLTGIEAFTNITGLNCGVNQLSNLDISQNLHLITLDFAMNAISNINVSQNTALTEIYCYSNNFQTIDLSQNTLLKKFFCFGNNSVTSINIANGNNSLLELIDASNCSNLTCFQVDNASYSTSNWVGTDFVKPSTVNWTENCFSSLSIQENNDKKTSIVAYPNPTSGITYLNEVGNIQVFDMSGRIVLEQMDTKIINLNNQNSGIYFVKVTNQTGYETLRIIKE